MHGYGDTNSITDDTNSITDDTNNITDDTIGNLVKIEGTLN